MGTPQRNRRWPWLVWAAGLLILIGCVAWKLAHPPPPPPANVEELAGRLRANGLRVVPDGPNAFYVTSPEDVREVGELHLLAANPSRLAEWKGTAHFSQTFQGGAFPWIVFGDPEMVDRAMKRLK